MKRLISISMILLTILSTFAIFAPHVKAEPSETAPEVAEKAATWILSQAIPEAGGYKWEFKSYWGRTFYESNVQWGSAGFGKFFLALYETTGNSLYLDYAEGAAKWVISQAVPASGGYKWAHPDDDIPSPGWWLSPTVSGIAEFLLRMYQTTGDSTYLDYAKGAAKWLMAMAYWGEPGCFIPYNPPGLYGTQAAHGIGPGREAYTVTFLLHLYQETGDTAYLPYVEGTATWLMSGPDKVAEGGGYKWRHGRPYGSGYSIDGNGRIATFFYEIYQALGKAEYLDYANKAMTWLLSQAVVVGDKAKWPDNQGSGSYPTLPFAGSFFGGRGEEARVCDLLMVAYEVTGDVMYLEYAKKLANWVISPAVAMPEGGGYRFPYYEGGSYYDVFHNARVYNFLSWMYDVAGETSYSEYADGALTWIIYKAEEVDGGYKWRTLDYSPYYATWFSGGAAGIGYYIASMPMQRRFDPKIDGFGFYNYALEAGCPIYNLKQVYDKVKPYLPITLSEPLPLVVAAMVWYYSKVHDFHCYGMSKAAIYYYDHPEDAPPSYSNINAIPSQDSVPEVKSKIEWYQHDQGFTDPDAWLNIIQHFFLDHANPMYPNGGFEDEIASVEKLCGELRPALLCFYGKRISDNKRIGHAVVGYNFLEEGDKYTIKVYDPNKPDDDAATFEFKRDGLNRLYIADDGYLSWNIDELYCVNAPLLSWTWDDVNAHAKELIEWVKEHLKELWDGFMVLKDQAQDQWNLFVNWVKDNAKDVWNRIVHFKLHSACDFNLYDSEGLHVGLSPTGDLDLGFDALYLISDELQYCAVVDPAVDGYLVELVGTDTGSYSLDVALTVDGTTITESIFSGEIVQGAVYAYRVSVADGTIIVKPDTTDDLGHLKDFINGLPASAFDKLGLVSQRKGALFAKIDEVILKVEAGNYTDAINKLLHDIRAKMDGDRTAMDWITDPTAQFKLCVIIDHIISNIQTLQEETG